MPWIFWDMFDALMHGWFVVGHIHFAHGVPWYNIARL